MAKQWKNIYTSSFGRVRYLNNVTESVYVTIQEYTEENVASKEISLPYNEPLVVEWFDTAKEDPIQGASCTLKVITEQDREFLHLFTKEPGTLRIIINGSSSAGHWGGLMDVEHYEEPYSTDNGYETTLTFRDFGFLDRYDFDKRGIMTIREIVDACIDKMGISVLGINDYTTTLVEGERKGLDNISVDCQNFYDEDGVPMTYKRVLESVLQPFAAKIIQRNRQIFIYDYHYLYGKSSKQIQWAGMDQSLALDKFINKIVITTSTYTNETLTEEMTTPFDWNLYKYEVNTLDHELGKEPCPYYSYYESRNAKDKLYNNVAFTIFLMRNLTQEQKSMVNATYSGQYAKPFHINPINGGSDGDGFAAYFFANDDEIKPGTSYMVDPVPYGVTNDVLFEVTLPLLPALEHPESFLLDLTLEAMIDYHYNPFNGEDEDNDPLEYADRYKYYSHTFKHLKIELLNDNDEVIKVYSNAPFLDQCINRIFGAWYSGGTDWNRWNDERWRLENNWWDITETTLDVADSIACIDNMSLGAWYDPTDAVFQKVSPFCWIDYYDQEAFKGPRKIITGSGTLGWSKNKHCYGSKMATTTTFNKRCVGQKIPYPPTSGRIRIKVLRGFQQHNNQMPYDVRSTRTYHDYKGFSYGDVRWVLYKLPEVKIVKNTTFYEDANFDDNELTCYVNDYASDTLNIDLVCGTTGGVEMPTSPARLLNTATKTQILAAYRAGKKGSLESLLAGTLFSQYYGRKIKLSGTARYNASIDKYIDASSPGKVFTICGEVADLKQGTSEVTYVEFDDDVYEEI